MSFVWIKRKINTVVAIENQGALTLIEALKFLPGSWVETRGRMVKQFVSFLGQKYPYPGYAINGIWQKEFHETPYFFSSSSIESIEVVRSSAALVKSLNGLTGVINVKTEKCKEPTLNFTWRYGSFNSYQAALSHGNHVNKINYSLSDSFMGDRWS